MSLNNTRLLAIAAIAALSVAACGGGGGASSSSGKADYVVGATEDLSGPTASYGKWAQQAWGAYFDQVNAKGGINGHHVKLILLDDAGDSNRALANVRRLVTQENALSVTGSTFSSICEALAPVVEQLKVPIMCTATPAGLVKPVQKDVFGRLAPENALVKPMLDYVPKVITGAKPKVAIITQGSVGAKAFASTVATEAKSRGWEVVAQEATQNTQGANIVGPAAKIAAAHPDVVITEFTPDVIVSFNRQVRSDGLDVPILSETADYSSLSTLQDPKFAQFWQRGLVNGDAPETSAAKDIVTALAPKGVQGTKDLNTGKIVEDWLAASAIGKALGTCGDSCTGAKLADALGNTMLNLPGVADKWGFTPNDHLAVQDVSVYQWDPTKNAAIEVAKGLPVGTL